MLLLPSTFEHGPKKSYRKQFKSSSTSINKSPSNVAGQFEKVFIHALVRAGQCSRHSKKTVGLMEACTANKSPSTHHRHFFVKSTTIRSRYFSSRAGVKSPVESATVAVTREELKDLVDYYSLDSEDGSTKASMDLLGDNPQTILLPDPPLEDEQVLIETTINELKVILEHDEPPHDLLWKHYLHLPQPRASHLPDSLLGDLLHHLSVVPYKTEPSMLRYLSLIEDVQAVNKPIKASHWTSAISFAGRCLRRISSSEVESALHLWRRMEHEAGVKGTNVTFGVLFDIATKAGKFVLAEMIMKEMETRNLRLNRHLRTGIIYHHGMRRDGNAVRKAYRDLVDAGEIVDSAVITCVVAALLKCGEAIAAEQVFERAKRLHWQKMDEFEAKVTAIAQGTINSNPHMDEPVSPPMPPENWRTARTLGIHLDHVARVLRLAPDPVQRNRIQNSVPLAPSVRTYRALIYYHAVTAGDIDRATELLAEMWPNGVEPDGIVHLHMFKGFSMHGGVAYTGWTRRRLERFWKEFCTLVVRDGVGWRQRNEDMASASSALSLKIYLNSTSAEYVLRAYAKVTGYERTLEIWEDIKSKWGKSMDMADEEHIDQVLDRLHPEWGGSGPGDVEEEDTGEAYQEEEQELDVEGWEDPPT